MLRINKSIVTVEKNKFEIQFSPHSSSFCLP